MISKMMKIAILGLMLLTLGGGAVLAQSCNSGAVVAADIWDKVDQYAVGAGCVVAAAYGVDYTLCFQGTMMINNLMAQLIQFWNQKANNSWATVGPRRLDLNVNHTGNLIGTGGRLFISLPVFKNRVTVTIDERGGKGKASVVVCKYKPDGTHSKVATRWFNDSQKRKNKTNERREIVVNGAKNQIISVHLDGKSVGNSFAYQVKATAN